MPEGKPFTWSYSRLKNFETCGLRHEEIDILKNYREDESEALQWGGLIHKSASSHLSTGARLPPGCEVLKPWCAKILTPGGNILTEQKLALNRNFGPTTYFAEDVWFRAVIDVLKIDGPVALVADWKTGKIIEDSVQLALSAACVFAHHPEIQRIRSIFIWLKENCETTEDFQRDDMANLWRSLWPRIEALEHAWETKTYLPKPGGLCRRWCPVTKCTHHGTG